MAVRNELVDAAVATKADGSTARKRTELSSRAAHLTVGGARQTSGRSTTRSAACSWRSGTGQGEVPRRTRHTVAGGFAAGHPLRASYIPAKARLHAGCAAYTGARHPRNNRHVRGNQQCSAKAATLSGTRQAGDFARVYPRAWRALGFFQS